MCNGIIQVACGVLDSGLSVLDVDVDAFSGGPLLLCQHSHIQEQFLHALDSPLKLQQLNGSRSV